MCCYPCSRQRSVRDMNYPIFYRALALGAAAVLAGGIAGCGGHRDCTQALVTADEAVREHQPTGEWLHRVDAVCADAAMERWSSALAQDCAPVFGFHAALTGAEAPVECAGHEFDSARSLGEMIAETRRELERRKIVIGRDLPQVEALARMDGYLPPAEIPGAEPSILE